MYAFIVAENASILVLGNFDEGRASFAFQPSTTIGRVGTIILLMHQVRQLLSDLICQMRCGFCAASGAADLLQTLRKTAKREF